MEKDDVKLESPLRILLKSVAYHREQVNSDRPASDDFFKSQAKQHTTRVALIFCVCTHVHVAHMYA